MTLQETEEYFLMRNTIVCSLNDILFGCWNQRGWTGLCVQPM